MANEAQMLNDNELGAWKSLLKAHATLVGALDRELEAAHNLGLPDYEVLSQLANASDKSLRMTELAREVLLSPSGLTRRLDGLVKAGLVERQPCVTDGRGLLAVITADGTRALEQMTPTYVGALRSHLVERVTPQQLLNITDALGAIAGDDQHSTATVAPSVRGEISIMSNSVAYESVDSSS